VTWRRTSPPRATRPATARARMQVKRAQAKARIWPLLSYVCQMALTVLCVPVAPACRCNLIPLSREHGTHKTVKARCWPWLSGKQPFELSCFRPEADFQTLRPEPRTSPNRSIRLATVRARIQAQPHVAVERTWHT